MYQVPHNPQNQRRWSIVLIFFYNAFVGIIAAIGSCALFVRMIVENRLDGYQQLSLLWAVFFIFINISRLGLGVGILRFRSWGYRGIVGVELLTIFNLLIQFVFKNERISWVEIGLSIIAMLMLGYLFQPNIKHQFL